VSKLTVSGAAVRLPDVLTATLAVLLLAGDPPAARALVAGPPELVKVDWVHQKGDNPCGTEPTRVVVRFGKAGELEVAHVAAWAKMFDADPEVRRACVTAPVAELARLLRSKGVPPPGRTLPWVGCVDATAYFTVQVRRVRFAGGEGILFVTQRFIEDVTTSNSGLEALFQGFSDDGKTWVGGTFGVRAKGLRDKGVDLLRDPAAFKATVAADGEMLAKLAPGDFEPSLDSIAAVIGGIDLKSLAAMLAR
jgi:hypothetical protein